MESEPQIHQYLDIFVGLIAQKIYKDIAFCDFAYMVKARFLIQDLSIITTATQTQKLNTVKCTTNLVRMVHQLVFALITHHDFAHDRAHFFTFFLITTLYIYIKFSYNSEKIFSTGTKKSTPDGATSLWKFSMHYLMLNFFSENSIPACAAHILSIKANSHTKKISTQPKFLITITPTQESPMTKFLRHSILK